MRGIFLVLFFAFVLVPVNQAEARTSPCDIILVPTKEQIAEKSERAIAYLDTFLEKIIDAQNSDGKTDLGISVPIKGIPLTGNLSKNKSKARSQLNEKKRTLKYDLTEDQARSLYRENLSDEQVKAWSNCVGAFLNKPTIMLSPQEEFRADGFSIKLMRRAGPGRLGTDWVVEVTGGKIDGKRKRRAKTETERADGDIPLTIVPDRGKKSVLITATDGASGDTIRVEDRQETMLCNVARTITACSRNCQVGTMNQLGLIVSGDLGANTTGTACSFIAASGLNDTGDIKKIRIKSRRGLFGASADAFSLSLSAPSGP